MDMATASLKRDHRIAGQKPPWHSLKELQGGNISKIELLGWIESMSLLKDKDSGKYGKIFRFLVKEEERNGNGGHRDLIALMREIRADVEGGMNLVHVPPRLAEAELMVDKASLKGRRRTGSKLPLKEKQNVAD
jgi:hypothetical protein